MTLCGYTVENNINIVLKQKWNIENDGCECLYWNNLLQLIAIMII